MVKVISRHNPRKIANIININSYASVKESKKGKREKKNKLRVISKHNPQEIVDIEEIKEEEIEEKTWEIRIEERKSTEVFEENQIEEINESENEARDILEIEGDLEEIDNPVMIKKIYKKYLGIPKEPGVEKSTMNTEILLINSLKINIGKIQEITDGFLINKSYTSIFCLTETKVNCANHQELGLTIYDKQRAGRPNQDKGGGLIIGHLTDEKVKLEKINTKNDDILVVEGEIHKEKIRIILVYFNCGKLTMGRRFNENRKIQEEVEQFMQVKEGTRLVVLGDLNARLRALEPGIDTDVNGRMIESWVTDRNLSHLNNTDKCEGKYTFGNPGGRRSAVDHILVNGEMQQNYRGMRVDENKEELNISDHNLLRCWFKLGRTETTKWEKKKTETRIWYTHDHIALEKMEKDLERRVRGPMSFKGMMAIIAVTQERHLRKTKKIQVGKKEKEEVLAAPWMDRKGRYMIKLRRRKNRAWRRARKMNAPRRVLQLLKRKYEAEKRITSIYLGKRKNNWEKEMIRKAHENSKTLWNFAKEIQGTKRRKETKTHVYIEGEKKAIETVWKLFIETWKNEIYQKSPEVDWTFWYGGRGRPGLKEEMRKEDEEDITNGGSKMMPLPVMKEEDLIRIVKRQKNGKAAGTDKVKTEVMKHMVKNKKIRKGLVNAFNKCLKEKIHPNWMESNTTMLPKSKKKQK